MAQVTDGCFRPLAIAPEPQQILRQAARKLLGERRIVSGVPRSAGDSERRLLFGQYPDILAPQPLLHRNVGHVARVRTAPGRPATPVSSPPYPADGIHAKHEIIGDS